ncbi:MAG TPA: bifunctional UDP-N-acetylglucosamine diphosphorylase/glucosamine-1-phosphate N-acetyltransferase GlmU [Ktedonobacterales bacterium]|nr:bifunctional UDP-N-acetylglucosamine diphosphorylase/glucosamine-1-phosphate N-acetyltransferase GlmU [Ktedonobacterales bacterium]
MRPVGVIILAAGKGTRMRSRMPKVAHQIAGRAMLEHAVRAAADAVTSPTSTTSTDDESGDDGSDHSSRFVIVVGHEADAVRAAVPWRPAHGELDWVTQERQLGTGDAVRVARQTMMRGDAAGSSPETVLVTYGDTPLVRPESLRLLLAEHERADATLTFLTGQTAEPNDYGRVLRDITGRVRGIVEAKHASPDELAISEVNSGIYAFAADWLWSRLGQLQPHSNGEYYLTDLIEVAVREGRRVATHSVALAETMGINDRVALAEAERVLRERLLRDLMLSGVTVVDPATTYVDAGVRVGQDTVIKPGCHLQGATVIGEGCDIGPASVIRDSQIGDGCQVQASWVEEAIMEPGSRIGPMSHLRPGAHLMPGANLGNFAEVKNSVIGERVQMHHFSYMGDASLGADTNVGAGTISMNYDGRNKHRTTVGERVFLGCDTLLRAPVTIGDDANTGAGSIVTRDVPSGTLVVGAPARLVRRVLSQGQAANDMPPPQEQAQASASDGAAEDRTARPEGERE